MADKKTIREQPLKGGSYARAKNGKLTRTAHTKEAAATAHTKEAAATAQPAEAPVAPPSTEKGND